MSIFNEQTTIPYTSGAGDKVNDIFRDIDSTIGSLRTSVEGAIKAVTSFKIDVPDVTPVTVQGTVDTSAITELINQLNTVKQNLNTIIEAVTSDTPKILDELSVLDTTISDLINAELPTVDLTVNTPVTPTSPAINLPSTPTVNEHSLPSEPNLDTVAFPDAPTLNDVEEPTLLNINLPSLPIIDLPTAPEDETFTSPELPNIENIDYTEEEYQEKVDTLLSAINELMDGGLESDFTVIERGILDRGVVELDEQYKSTLEEEKIKAERLGYSIPPGIILNRFDQARNDYVKKVNALFNELKKDLIELANSNRKTAMSSGIELEKAYMSLFNEAMARKLEKFKVDVDKEIRLFEAKVTLLKASLDIYLTKFQVYSEKIKAELSKVEIYKSQIDGQKLISDLNKNILELYRSKLSVNELAVSIYEKQVSAAAERLRAELSKVDVFKAQIDAYVAKLRGEELKVNVYQSLVQAETTKVSIYEQQIRAYLGQLQAEESKINIEKVKLETAVSELTAKTSLVNSLSNMIISKVTAQSELYKVKVSAYEAIARLYDSVVKPLGDAIQAEGLHMKIINDINLANLQAQLETNLKQVDAELKQGELDFEKIRAAASMGTTLLAAYVNALNVSASISDTSSYQASQATGEFEYTNTNINT